ncbi:MAG: ribosome biogenesis factor YjgA [Steroidobacteraceae bacterium]
MRRRQLPGEPPPPTKGELKRRARNLQDLVQQLMEVPEELVAGLDLPEKLCDAIALARRITSHSALVRQKLFIGKLLRKIDSEPIRAALEAVSATARLETMRFRRAERWRDRLLVEGQAAIVEFAAEFPHADRTELVRLASAAAALRAGDRAAAAKRELFRWVRQVIDG